MADRWKSMRKDTRCLCLEYILKDTKFFSYLESTVGLNICLREKGDIINYR